MLALLRDAAWQGIGAFLAIAIAFVLYFLQRRRRELAFGVLYSRELLTVAEEVASRIEISLDGQRIKNLQVLTVGIKNSGDEAIAETDFAIPLSISIEGTGSIVSASVVKQHPSNLGLQVTAGSAEVSLSPLLLNPKDFAIIKILYSGKEPRIVCHARVRGIHELSGLNRGIRFGPREKRESLKNLAVICFIGLLVFAAGKALDKPVSEMYPFLGVFAGLVFAVGIWSWAQGTLTNSQRRYIDDA